MTIALLALLAAAAPVDPAAAAARPPIVEPTLPPIADPNPAGPGSGPAQGFTALCSSVHYVGNWQFGKSFSFACTTLDGLKPTIRVGKLSDRYGRDPGTESESATWRDFDLYNLVATAAMIQAFMAIKAADPNSPARLTVSGDYSKYPPRLNEMVTTYVQLYSPQP